MKIIKFTVKWMLLILLAYVLYLIVGAILPYRNQPGVSEATRQAFRASDYYGEQTGADRARIIDQNGEALDLRMQMIAHAKERIILSTFDFRPDQAGKDLLAALVDAADRGVKVEVFADGFNSRLRMDNNPYFYALSAHPNGTIRVYNPVNLLKPWMLMGRMHDKYLIVDDTAYLLGGRNAFGYFLGDYPGHKNHDWDVLVYHDKKEETSSLEQVEAYYRKITALDYCTIFGEDEKLAERDEVKEARAKLKECLAQYQKEKPEIYEQEYDYYGNTLETSKITLLSNPVGYQAKEPVVFYSLMQLAKESEEPVVIHTPYIMCNDWMYEELSGLGDKATLMFNSAANNGNPFAALDYMQQKQKLIDTGVNILEYEGGISYHGKVMSFGSRLALVGSFNMDMRSTYLDTELMLVIDSKPVNESLRTKMKAYEKDAALVKDLKTYARIPEGMTMKEVSTERKVLLRTVGWLLHSLRFLL